MTTQSDWHVEDIKSAIRKAGSTCEGLAVRNDYHRLSVKVALRKPWPKLEAIIARHLGVLPQTIWPSRYDADGRPLPRSSNRCHRLLPIAGGPRTHRKTGEAG